MAEGDVGEVLGDGRLRQHPAEPSTFDGASPLSGLEWFAALGRAHAAIQGELLVGSVVLGQLGALAHFAPEEARKCLEAVEIDVRDFEDAAELYVKTVRGIIANARANLSDGG